MKPLQSVSLRKNDLKSIEEASALLKRDFPVVEVKLFGSKARGDDTMESDIDLLALTSEQLSWQERDRMRDSLYDIQLKHDVLISLLIVSREAWNNGLMAIHGVIEDEGVAA